MKVPRTELHDDLRVLIAAGRELSPEDDAVLADMFLDRLDRTMQKRRPGRMLSARTIRRCAGVAVLAFALLTGGAFVSVQQSSHQSQSSVPQSVVAKAGPNVKVLPVVPSGKYRLAPAVPVPKDVPLKPNG
jgi:hypothetical protein